MLIYEVNVSVNQEVADAFEVWLVKHIKEVVEVGRFEKVERYKTAPAEWTIHYHVKDRKTLDTYLENHAPRLRQEGLDKFPGQFSATRRILELLRR